MTTTPSDIGPWTCAGQIDAFPDLQPDPPHDTDTPPTWTQESMF